MVIYAFVLCGNSNDYQWKYSNIIMVVKQLKYRNYLFYISFMAKNNCGIFCWL